MRISLLLLICVLFEGVPAKGADAKECFKAQLHEELVSKLILFDDGTYIRVDDLPSSPWHDRGTWTKGSGGRYALISDREIRQLHVGRLTVSPMIKDNLSLLKGLREEVRKFLRSHSGEMFEPELIRAISAFGDPCLDEDQYICCGACDEVGQGKYCINIEVEPTFAANNVSRNDLKDLMTQIKKFKRQGNLNVFHMYTISHRDITAALWEEEGPTWSRRRIPEAEVRELIEWSKSRESFSFLMQVDCAGTEFIRQSNLHDEPWNKD